MKVESSGQIFEKYSNINFHENPSVGNPVYHADGHMGRQDMRKANSRLSLFCERAWKPV